MTARTLAAVIGTMAFSLLFSVPRKYYLCCGLIGGAGWWLYALLYEHLGCSAAEATFFATVAVALLSRVCAVWQRCPVTVFLITGIFPLVPGAGVYWAAYHLVMDQLEEGAASGFAAVKAAAAIVLGIVLVLELPARLFRRK